MPVLIIPGLYGSGPDHWQSHWERDIPDAYRVMQADWARPGRDAWLARLVEEIERRPNSVLVAHSLGATLIAHLAALRSDLPVKGALLVAPADPTQGRTDAAGVSTFAPLPTEPFAFPTIVVASRNDPHMAQIRASHLAQLWGSAFVDAGASGHINTASGHNRWSEGRLLLQRLRGPSPETLPVETGDGSAVVVPLRRRRSVRRSGEWLAAN